MDLSLLLLWAQDHILAILVVIVTSVLIYYYLIERDKAVKLSHKYRNSIFEAQSKIFLNATRYLIEGQKDLAIKEFLNAVDINRETIETYFALGRLFRSNGEIEKAISIHRSLIARKNITELTRTLALQELAIDFDKGGLVDKAIETYKDVLKINRDRPEVIRALCRIFEDIEDWDQAFNFRVMLSKIISEDQSETISHILVQKAKNLFFESRFTECQETLEEAMRYAPSVSAQILRLKLFLLQGNMDDGKLLFTELLNEYSMYISFIFVSLNEIPEKYPAENKELWEKYLARIKILKDYFVTLKGDELWSTSVVLSKVRLLKENGDPLKAYNLLKEWIGENDFEDVLKIEFIRLLVELDKIDEAVHHIRGLLNNLHKSLTRYFCRNCGYDSDNIFWRCPQCREWETIQFRWKL